MNKIIKVLGTIFFIIQLINFLYILNFYNCITKNSIQLGGKTVFCSSSSNIENFFTVELIIFFITLIIVARIMDIAVKNLNR
jgi:hypothetical protein